MLYNFIKYPTLTDRVYLTAWDTGRPMAGAVSYNDMAKASPASRADRQRPFKNTDLITAAR